MGLWLRIVMGCGWEEDRLDMDKRMELGIGWVGFEGEVHRW